MSTRIDDASTSDLRFRERAREPLPRTPWIGGHLRRLEYVVVDFDDVSRLTTTAARAPGAARPSFDD